MHETRPPVSLCWRGTGQDGDTSVCIAHAICCFAGVGEERRERTSMMDSEKELRAIITELFQIIDQATLNIATWPQVDALRKRYQELQQEKSEEHIWFQDDWI